MRSRRFRKRSTLRIRPTAPFHFDGTFHKSSHFPVPIGLWEPGRRWQTIRAGGHLYAVKIEDRSTAAKPQLRVSIYSDRQVTPPERESIRRELVWRFDLDSDLSEFARRARGDRRFRAVFPRWRGARDSNFNTLYELLVIALLLQNATVRRTVQMMNALLDAFGTKVRFDSKSIYAMWQPEDLSGVSEDDLRALKIGYRRGS